jgi:hypothetical protein
MPDSPVSQSGATDQNLLSDLPSLRMTKHDQRILDRRLRDLAADSALSTIVRAYLLRASYELEKA